mgnify:CR=1 FL=1
MSKGWSDKYHLYKIHRFKAQHRNVYNEKYTFGFPAATDSHEKSAEANIAQTLREMLRRFEITAWRREEDLNPRGA